MTSYSKTLWQNETKASDIVLMLHDCMTYGINMKLQCWMGAVKSKCQFNCS